MGRLIHIQLAGAGARRVFHFFSNLFCFEDEDELDAQSRWLTQIQREGGEEE